MRKIDEVQDPASCLNKARSDEPIFVLRAKDPAAPPTVREWARRYTKAKGGKRALTAKLRQKIETAYMLADHMDAWALENGYITPTGAPTGKA